MTTQLRATAVHTGSSAIEQAPPSTEEMKRVSAEFESVFLSQILGGMTKGLAGTGLSGGQDSPFASMLQDEYAKLISRSGGIGLADSILREMLKMQEAQPSVSTA